MKRARALLAALLLATLAPHASRAAQPAPDATALHDLQASAARWNRFRLSTDRGRFDVSVLVADADGVMLERTPKPPLLQVRPGEETDPPRRVSWAEIRSIDAGRSHRTAGVVIGAIVGFVGGFVGLALSGAFIEGTDDSSVYGGVGLGAATGALLGGAIASSGGWHRIYPRAASSPDEGR